MVEVGLEGTMQGVEREPSLGPEQLPPDQRIPNDQLLRGASAVEVIGAVRSWLQANFPPPRSVRVQIAESEEDIARIEHKWRRLAERKGLPRSQGDIDRNVRAARLFNEVVLLPQVLTEFSGSIWQRARAARTLAHEWWRISRLAEGSFPPFEEGSADVFADLALRRMTGFDASKVGFRQYPKQAQAVEAQLEVFGEPWLFESRKVFNVSFWLERSLLEAGYPPLLVEQALEYTWEGEVRLTRIRRLLASQKGSP